MEYIYTAVFTPIENGKGFYARIPDLPGCVTTGKDIPEAIDMITDAASLWLVVAEDKDMLISAPPPQNDLDLGPDDICTLIRIDTLAYREIINTNETVKKYKPQ